MPALGAIGVPQIAALLVLAQRGLEELYSARNTRALRARGASEAGGEFYPVVAATHLAWIASVFFLIPAGAPIIWPLIAYYLALQVARYWIIASLGRLVTISLRLCGGRAAQVAQNPSILCVDLLRIAAGAGACPLRTSGLVGGRPFRHRSAPMFAPGSVSAQSGRRSA